MGLGRSLVAAAKGEGAASVKKKSGLVDRGEPVQFGLQPGPLHRRCLPSLSRPGCAGVQARVEERRWGEGCTKRVGGCWDEGERVGRKCIIKDKDFGKRKPARQRMREPGGGRGGLIQVRWAKGGRRCLRWARNKRSVSMLLFLLVLCPHAQHPPLPLYLCTGIRQLDRRRI
ncbi:hypothetical protein GQ54DRAFT_132057 [Martensiomyces pterosporus]|nr:hypothetical protein GQ54DRAFT_132057 [Martensiomyces pterosporus]